MNQAIDKFGDVVEIISITGMLVEFKYPNKSWTLFMGRGAFDKNYKAVTK